MPLTEVFVSQKTLSEHPVASCDSFKLEPSGEETERKEGVEGKRKGEVNTRLVFGSVSYEAYILSIGA